MRCRCAGRLGVVTDRLGWQRAAVGVAVLGVVAASLITGELWRVAVDDGGSSSGNPIGRYGPHWLYPAVVAIVVGVLVTTLLLRPVRRTGTMVALTAAAAGGAGNLAQWVVLGGVSNPIGPLPGIHGAGHASIGDACLWLGILALVLQAIPGPSRKVQDIAND
jgi:hypothetical protein